MEGGAVPPRLKLWRVGLPVQMQRVMSEDIVAIASSVGEANTEQPYPPSSTSESAKKSINGERKGQRREEESEIERERERERERVESNNPDSGGVEEKKRAEMILLRPEQIRTDPLLRPERAN